MQPAAGYLVIVISDGWINMFCIFTTKGLKKVDDTVL